jgi:hypothetical protein
MCDAIVAGVSGMITAIALHMFYRAARHRWPENYSTLSGALESLVTRSLGYYLSFRITPVYLAAIFLAVTMDRLDLPVTVAVAAMIVIHLGATNGRAIAVILRREPSDSRRGVLLLFHSFTGLLVVATGLAATLTFTLWRGFIPVPRDVVFALWTGIIAAVLAAYTRSFERTVPTEEELVERAREDLGESLWDFAKESAWRHDCDPTLVRSVIVTEVTQRPHWFRDLERIKGKFLPSGTYGAAQMSSPRPLTDEESIEALAASFAGYYPERSAYGTVKREWLAARLEAHNPTTAFRDICLAVYEHLESYAVSATESRAHDGRPVIEIQSLERRGGQWLLKGTASVHEARLAYVAHKEGESFRGSIVTEVAAPRRGGWELLLPLRVQVARIFEGASQRDLPPGNEEDIATLDFDHWS